MTHTSALLTMTKDIVGRVAASAMASASPIIVLMHLHVGPEVKGRHQARLMTVLHTKATDMMRAAACLHRNNTRPQSREETQQTKSLDTFAENDRAVSIQPRKAANRFCPNQSQEPRYPSECSFHHSSQQ